MWLWNKFKSIFATTGNNGSNSETKKNTDILISKNLEKQFIKDVKYGNINNTPVFLTFLIIVLVVNLAFFFLTLVKNKIGKLQALDEKYFALFFGANHTSAIFEGKQIWRIITYAFIEEVNGFQIIISGIFIWLTFYSVGFYQESFLGWKNTLIIWGVGIPLIGLTQLLLTKNEAIYYYGTEYLSWLSVGSLTFLWIGQTIKNEQLRGLARNRLLRTALFLFIFAILRYVWVQNGIKFDNNRIMRVGSYYITFALLSFFVGFFITLLLRYHFLTSNIALYGAVIFFVILGVTLIAMTYLAIKSYSVGDSTWRIIKDFYG